MSVLRVTLGSGETHDVEVGPGTVVSFQTDVGTGDGRTLRDVKAWCDVASIDPVGEEPAVKGRVRKHEPEAA